MPLPYDATLKDMAQAGPGEFLGTFESAPNLPAQLLNVDLSTVTTAADVAIGLGQPLREIVHFDAQTGPSATLHQNVCVYNVLLHRLYNVPVHSIVLLLRPQARHPNLTGSLAYQARPGRGKMDFSFEVINLWERPVNTLLSGGLSASPLAVLGQLPQVRPLEVELAEVIHLLGERVEREAPQRAQRLLTAAFVLTGLRLGRQAVRRMFQGVQAMRDSDTYQAILDEGREEGRTEGEVQGQQRMLLRQGSQRFGRPSARVKAALGAIKDIPHLEALGLKLFTAGSWEDLLGLTPARGRRN